MPHTTIPKAPSPTKTESPKVRYTDVVYPYSGLFPFAANTTQAAKEKGLTVNKSILTEKYPPEKVAYRGKTWPNRVKKEFDAEGAGAKAVFELNIKIRDIHLGSTQDEAVTIFFSDGSTQNVSLYRNIDEDWASFSEIFIYDEPRAITSLTVNTAEAVPELDYICDLNGFEIPAGHRRRLSLDVQAQELVDEPEEGHCQGFAPEDFGIQAYHFGARTYDPVVGQWLAVDPESQEFPGLSVYSYTLNNPVYYTDPDGAEPVSATLAISLIGAAAVGLYNMYRAQVASVNRGDSYRASVGIGVLTYGASVTLGSAKIPGIPYLVNAMTTNATSGMLTEGSIQLLDNRPDIDGVEIAKQGAKAGVLGTVASSTGYVAMLRYGVSLEWSTGISTATGIILGELFRENEGFEDDMMLYHDPGYMPSMEYREPETGELIKPPTFHIFDLGDDGEGQEKNETAPKKEKLPDPKKEPIIIELPDPGPNPGDDGGPVPIS